MCEQTLSPLPSQWGCLYPTSGRDSRRLGCRCRLSPSCNCQALCRPGAIDGWKCLSTLVSKTIRSIATRKRRYDCCKGPPSAPATRSGFLNNAMILYLSRSSRSPFSVLIPFLDTRQNVICHRDSSKCDFALKHWYSHFFVIVILSLIHDVIFPPFPTEWQWQSGKYKRNRTLLLLKIKISEYGLSQS